MRVVEVHGWPPTRTSPLEKRGVSYPEVDDRVPVLATQDVVPSRSPRNSGTYCSYFPVLPGTTVYSFEPTRVPSL